MAWKGLVGLLRLVCEVADEGVSGSFVKAGMEAGMEAGMLIIHELVDVDH